MLRLDIAAVVSSPFLWSCELALPNAPFCLLCRPLFSFIFAIGQRPSRLDHCAIERSFSSLAACQHTIIAIASIIFTMNSPACYQSGQCGLSLAATWIVSAISCAGLEKFRRINAVQSDALAVQFQ